jgi:hypothetical protein
VTSPRHLTAVRGTSKRDQYDARCRVAVQAVLEGMQEVRVQAVTPLAGPGHGQVAVRVGRLLIYINDREALDSFLGAWQQAAELGDRAFGVALPPPAYKPRSATRRR